MKLSTRWLSACLLVLLFATEGHMSSGVQKMDLKELIQRSDAILVVKKGKPYIQHEAWPFPNRKEPPFKATFHRFEVVSAVKGGDSLGKGKKIRVFWESDEDNYIQTKRYLEDQPVAMTIHPSYQPMTRDADSANRFIIFIQHNETTGRYAFTASGAMEKEEAMEKIRHVLREGLPHPSR